jgi:6-phosphofructokinase 2
MRVAPEEPMEAIVTLTMNPALDVSTSVPHVLPERKLRCDQPRHEPGGGGINVARAVRRLGGEALAWFPAAGPAGDLLQQLLRDEGVPQRVVPTREWTRENLNVVEGTSGRQFRFCMPGPALAEPEWRCFLDDDTTRGAAPAFLVASGSLPPGVPADFYARLATRARERGSRVVLDTSGEPLAHAVEAGVYLLKPSLREFRALTGDAAEDERALVALAVDVVTRRRWCDVLVLSLGAAGALWVSAGGGGRLLAPAVPVKSTVGAGDSMVAAIVHGLVGGRSLADAVRAGVAAGAAAVLNPGTQLCHRADVERLEMQVAVTPL